MQAKELVLSSKRAMIKAMAAKKGCPGCPQTPELFGVRSQPGFAGLAGASPLGAPLAWHLGHCNWPQLTAGSVSWPWRAQVASGWPGTAVERLWWYSQTSGKVSDR